MMHVEDLRLRDGWVIALALGLGACGGTVDLRGEDQPTAGSGGEVSVGGAGVGGGGVGSGGFGLGGGGSPTELDPPLEDGDFGKLLAYDANPNGLGSAIYLTSLEAKGCSYRLTEPAIQAKQPVFSRDGTRMAYAARADGAFQIHVLDLETGEAEQVTDLPYGATSPSFSPDGARIAFLAGDSDGAAQSSGEGEFDVMVLDLEEGTPRVVYPATEGGCCVMNNRAPTFFGDDELALRIHTALVGIDLNTLELRDIMPSSGRIPEPTDPSMAPDGMRYAYSDYCSGSFSMYIGRVDGSSGDTCTGATSIQYAQQLVGADWGAFGYIAAHLRDANYGLVVIDDETLEVSPLPAVRGAKNPSWGPADLVLPLECQEPR